MGKRGFLVGVLLLASAAPANAVCIYKGELYATTSLSQEFGDSRVVVRGHVLSVDKNPVRNPEGDLSQTYRFQVDEVFKGSPLSTLRYYTPQNSGGFYLHRRTEYLLFLNPMETTDSSKDALGNMVVNYECGQSRPWTEVRDSDRSLLKSLAGKTR